LAYCTAAFLLCACSSYQKFQTEADINKPYDCTGLHMNYASWRFSDEYDQDITVTGRCSKGMKHGYFNFFVDGYQVARTKFTRNQEVETLCYAIGNKHTIDLRTCMIDNVRKTKNIDVPQEKKKTQYGSSWEKSPWD
jgi:hypothetical protein